jgi:hypothetical protein
MRKRKEIECYCLCDSVKMNFRKNGDRSYNVNVIIEILHKFGELDQMSIIKKAKEMKEKYEFVYEANFKHHFNNNKNRLKKYAYFFKKKNSLIWGLKDSYRKKIDENLKKIGNIKYTEHQKQMMNKKNETPKKVVITYSSSSDSSSSSESEVDEESEDEEQPFFNNTASYDDDEEEEEEERYIFKNKNPLDKKFFLAMKGPESDYSSVKGLKLDSILDEFIATKDVEQNYIFTDDADNNNIGVDDDDDDDDELFDKSPILDTFSPVLLGPISPLLEDASINEISPNPVSLEDKLPPVAEEEEKVDDDYTDIDYSDSDDLDDDDDNKKVVDDDTDIDYSDSDDLDDEEEEKDPMIIIKKLKEENLKLKNELEEKERKLKKRKREIEIFEEKERKRRKKEEFFNREFGSFLEDDLLLFDEQVNFILDKEKEKEDYKTLKILDKKLYYDKRNPNFSLDEIEEELKKNQVRNDEFNHPFYDLDNEYF